MSDDRVDPENDFRIDRNRLDEEWIQHPQKYYDWTELLATAIKDRDQLILDRKIKKAELHKQAVTSFGTDKWTVGEVEAEVRRTPAYRKISEELIDAEEQVNLMEAGKWSMGKKTKSLDRLSDSRDRGYGVPNHSSAEQPSFQERRIEILDKKEESANEVDRALRKKISGSTRIKRGGAP